MSEKITPQIFHRNDSQPVHPVPKPSDVASQQVEHGKISAKLSQLDQLTTAEQIQTLEQIHEKLVQELGRIRI